MIPSTLPEHRCTKCGNTYPSSAKYERVQVVFGGGEFDGATGTAVRVWCPSCGEEGVILWQADL